MNMSPIKSKSKQKSRKNSKPTSNSRKRKMNRGNITKSNIPQKRQISDPVSTEKMLKSNAKHQKKNESAVLKKQLPDAKKQLNTNSDTTNYNTNEQLETDQQQMVVKLQTMLQQKNFELAQLNLQNLQLKTDIEVISKNNGNKHTELENKLKEQEATINQLTENLKQREAELETIMTNMKKVEERNMELTKQNLQLSTKIANTTKYIEALKDQHNRKIDMLNNQKLKLMGDVSHYQSNIVKLAEVNEQLKTANINASVIAQIQLDAAINESNELRKKLEELEEELHEVNVTALEAEVKEKVAYQAQLDQMTRQKNIIISQLTFKLNQITNLCILPVKSEKTAADQQENQSNTTQKIMSKLLLAVNSVGPNEDSDNNGTTSNPPCS